MIDYVYDNRLFFSHGLEKVALTVAPVYICHEKGKVFLLRRDELSERIAQGQSFNNVGYLPNNRGQWKYGSVKGQQEQKYHGLLVLQYDTLPSVLSGWGNLRDIPVTDGVLDSAVLHCFAVFGDFCVPMNIRWDEISFGCASLLFPNKNFLATEMRLVDGVWRLLLGAKEPKGYFAVLSFGADGMAEVDLFGDGYVVWRFPYYSKGYLAKCSLMSQPLPDISDGMRICACDY